MLAYTVEHKDNFRRGKTNKICSFVLFHNKKKQQLLTSIIKIMAIVAIFVLFL